VDKNKSCIIGDGVPCWFCDKTSKCECEISTKSQKEATLPKRLHSTAPATKPKEQSSVLGDKKENDVMARRVRRWEPPLTVNQPFGFFQKNTTNLKDANLSMFGSVHFLELISLRP
jgi:hypothetical protein